MTTFTTQTFNGSTRTVHLAFNEAGEYLGQIEQFKNTKDTQYMLNVYKMPVPRIVTEDVPATELEHFSQVNTLAEAKKYFI